MGKQTNIYFIGRAGHIVGATWKGTPYFRFQPGSIHQTAGTIKSGKLLGICSGMGAAFRKTFAEAIAPFKTKETENRFTGALKKCLQAKPFSSNDAADYLPFITGFNFNIAYDASSCLTVVLTQQINPPHNAVLHIPSFVPVQSMPAPNRTVKVHITLITAGYHLHAKCIIGTHTQQFTILYNNESVAAQDIVLPWAVPEQSLTLTLLSMRYVAEHKGRYAEVEEKTWMPCMVVAGCLIS